MNSGIWPKESTDDYRYPIGAFRFEVRINGSSKAVAGFSQFSGVKMEVETLQVRSGDDGRGVQKTVPVFTKFAPVTLTQGVVGDNDFLDWLLSAAAGSYAGPSGEMPYRTLEIVALDTWGMERVTWTLIDALPIGYELSPMDSGRSEVLSESLTLAIAGMKRETHFPYKGKGRREGVTGNG